MEGRDLGMEIAMGVAGVYDGSVGSMVGNVVSGRDLLGKRKRLVPDPTSRIEGKSRITSSPQKKEGVSVEAELDEDESSSVLAEFGVEVFGDKEGKMTLSEFSSRKGEQISMESIVRVSDLFPGEGGFALPWKLDKNGFVERSPHGTSCIPIWKDENGEIRWDQEEVDKFNKKHGG